MSAPLRRHRCASCGTVFYRKAEKNEPNAICGACEPQKAPKKTQRRPREKADEVSQGAAE